MQEQSAHSTPQDHSVHAQQKEKSLASTLVEYGKTILITVLAALLLKVFVLDAYRIPSTSMENTLQIGDFLLVNKLAYGLRTPRHLPLVALTIPSFKLPFFQNIHRGDVIVFEFPGGMNEITSPEYVNYIKRCIGLPGDTLEIHSGLVYVNKILIPFPPHGIQTDHPNRNSWRQNPEMFPQGSTFSNVNYGPIIVPKQGDILKLEPTTIAQWRILIEREGHTVRTADNIILIDGTAASTYRVRQNYYFVLGDNRDNSMDSRYWGFVPDDHLVGEALFVYWSWDTEVSVSNISEKLSTIRWKRIGTLIR
jgi:signal peptidase I